MKKSFLTILFLFCLFITPSLAVTNEEITQMMSNENYTTVVIEKSGVFYQPEKWDSAYKNVAISGSVYSSNINESTALEFNDKSISEIVESLGGYVYGNEPNYSYTSVVIPNENYENLTEIFKSLGFNVLNNTWAELLLNESRTAIGLPYSITGSPSYELTGQDTKIAIIDSGIDDTHPDFGGECNPNASGFCTTASKIIFWNDTTPERMADCVDGYGHGTFCAGIAAGNGMDSSGKFKGIAPNANLIIFKACDIGGSCDLEWIANAIQQSINLKPDVISLSIGIGQDDMRNEFGINIGDACTGNVAQGNKIKHLYDSIINAININIVFVAGAGNDGPTSGTIAFPACMSDVIAVGAAIKKDYPDHFNAYEQNGDKTGIHAIVTVLTDNPSQVKEYNWTASMFMSGFQLVVEPQIWPATIEVKYEGKHKIDDDWFLAGREHWDPGSDAQGDKYWAVTKTFDSGSAVFIEFLARPYVNDWFCGNPAYWCYNHYFNDLVCTGTALSCDSFDSNKNSCNNRAGCNWCGCGVFYEGIGPTNCYPDMSQADCHGCWGKDIQHCYVWVACDGTATSCTDRNNKDGGNARSNISREDFCGTPSTTGCSASWQFRDCDAPWIVNGEYTGCLRISINETDSPSIEGVTEFRSSRGPAPQGTTKPDVVAPGTGICSARAMYNGKYPDMGGGVEPICGDEKYARRPDNVGSTSAATPHVAGLVALLKEATHLKGLNPSVNDIKNALKKTDENIIGVNPNNIEGYGRINTTKAINYITNCSLKFEDGWYCNGNTREYRDYYYDSASGSCKYSVTQNENCNSYDNWVCSGIERCYFNLGDTNEYRDYYCSEGDCIYSLTSSNDCRCGAYDSDNGQSFTVKGNCTDYLGCWPGTCISNKVEDYCLNSTTLREYYVSGTGDSATCSYIDKKCSNLGDYLCSGGACKKKIGGRCLGCYILPY
jgi:hypothetical protein